MPELLASVCAACGGPLTGTASPRDAAALPGSPDPACAAHGDRWRDRRTGLVAAAVASVVLWTVIVGAVGLVTTM